LDESIISICVDQLSSILDSPLIIVHGAGSFGHHHAKSANLSSSSSTQSSPLGISKVRNSVSRLNQILCDRFIASSIPVFPIHPGDHVLLCKDDTFDFTRLIDITRRALECGFIPVIHGDVVVSLSGSARVLGGDEIMMELSKVFLPSGVAFLTNVDGVLDQEGEVIQNLNHDTEVVMRGSEGTIDVTGGMASKIEQGRAIADLGIDVFILKAGSASALDFLVDRNVSVGTRVLAKPNT
jgi:isopentenyl phosphate kinase